MLYQRLYKLPTKNLLFTYLVLANINMNNKHKNNKQKCTQNN